MQNKLTEDTKTTLLLCGVFGKDKSLKSLSPTEYNRIVSWLVSAKLRPSNLMTDDALKLASQNTNLSYERLQSLLSRGMQLAMATEEWHRQGVWIVSRSDEVYPERFKRHLKASSPPLLFGVGNASLLSSGGLAMVGSRNVDEHGIQFTKEIAKQCAKENVNIVSGGARGVDNISMNTSLEYGGTTLGILANNLLKTSMSFDARVAISEGRMLLVSPYHPNARFTVGNAMGRNKLIYALADYALVVSSDYGKGGTWAGAVEELKRENAKPVFVRTDDNTPNGNIELSKKGAIQFNSESLDTGIIEKLSGLVKKLSTLGLDRQSLSLNMDAKDSPLLAGETNQNQSQQVDSIYNAVLPIIVKNLENPLSKDDLAEILQVNKTQLNEWLKQAIQENKVSKLNKPVRYQAINNSGQMALQYR